MSLFDMGLWILYLLIAAPLLALVVIPAWIIFDHWGVALCRDQFYRERQAALRKRLEANR